MTTAHLTCLKYLRSYRWKYVILLQNNDVKLRTNAELVKILKTFNGANDISASKPGIHTYNSEANWTLAALNLFKNKELNTLHSLNITKSLVQVSISREAVNYVFDELNVDVFIKQLELKEFGVDELFWATLNTDEVVNLPGGFMRKHLIQNNQTYMATRFTVWVREKNPLIPCRSKFFRRWVCVFGAEDLPNLIHLYHLYVNKLLSNFDFAAVTCLLEHVYNQTYFPIGNHSLDLKKYSQLPHIKLHSQKINSLDQHHQYDDSSTFSYW
ncbi:hypothetical protein FO519_001977 [Halicephalobus sp. NKZ332]|nr:hypothetical protein FO519_001977 [Halicephalobus sp. NKZ332]